MSGVLERGREARESELLDDQRRLAVRRGVGGSVGDRREMVSVSFIAV